MLVSNVIRLTISQESKWREQTVGRICCVSTLGGRVALRGAREEIRIIWTASGAVPKEANAGGQCAGSGMHATVGSICYVFTLAGRATLWEGPTCECRPNQGKWRKKQVAFVPRSWEAPGSNLGTGPTISFDILGGFLQSPQANSGTVLQNSALIAAFHTVYNSAATTIQLSSLCFPLASSGCFLYSLQIALNCILNLILRVVMLPSSGSNCVSGCKFRWCTCRTLCAHTNSTTLNTSTLKVYANVLLKFRQHRPCPHGVITQERN
jgi:hypothetical protein